MKNYLLVLLLTVFLFACEEVVKPDADISDGPKVSAVDAQTSPVSYDLNAINDPNSVLAKRVIYFDYDSSKVDNEYLDLIKHHGKYLAANPDVEIRLESHTDERGTREYNVALADRRGKAVQRLLVFQGASSGQIIMISYGEEKPASLGHDSSAWSLNRRAELIYQ